MHYIKASALNAIVFELFPYLVVKEIVSFRLCDLENRPQRILGQLLRFFQCYLHRGVDIVAKSSILRFLLLDGNGSLVLDENAIPPECVLKLKEREGWDEGPERLYRDQHANKRELEWWVTDFVRITCVGGPEGPEDVIRAI